MTVYIYTRVSSSQQGTDTNVSMDMQISNCIDFAINKGLKYSEKYSEIRSARDMSKQVQLQKLLKIVKSGDKILVYNASRFSRDSAKAIECLKNLAKIGVEIISVSDNLSSISNRVGFRYKLLEANEESDVLSDRVRGAIAYVRSIGGRLGPAPFGYKNVRKGLGENMYKPLTLTENDAEIALIREIIFRVENKTEYDEIMELEGIGICNVIAGKFNEQGKLKRGKKWNAWTVKEVYNKFKNKFGQQEKHDTMDDDDDQPIDEDTLCEICQKDYSVDGDLMVLCDTCNKGFHQSCVSLLQIPKGSFFCGLSCRFQKKVHMH